MIPCILSPLFLLNCIGGLSPPKHLEKEARRDDARKDKLRKSRLRSYLVAMKGPHFYSCYIVNDLADCSQSFSSRGAAATSHLTAVARRAARAVVARLLYLPLRAERRAPWLPLPPFSSCSQSRVVLRSPTCHYVDVPLLLTA